MSTEAVAAATERYLRSKLDEAVFPGAVWLVGTSERILFEGAAGDAVVVPEPSPARVDTIYDIASLSKVVATTTLVLDASGRGVIDLETPVSRVLDELGGTDKALATWTDLLTHRSGLEAWFPLYTDGEGRESYLASISRLPLASAPRTVVTYSDLGFILLGLALERVFDRPLDDLARERIFEPLGMMESTYLPPEDLRPRIAATDWGNSIERAMIAERGLSFGRFRDRMLQGEVNDANAWHMGGVAGHAGVFSTARDLWVLAASLLRGDGVLSRDLLDRAIGNMTAGLGEARGLGWQLRSTREGHPSFVLSDRVFGHTGFTGTSLFVDPEIDRIFILLTNRTHPSMRPGDFQLVRRGFHEVARG